MAHPSAAGRPSSAPRRLRRRTLGAALLGSFVMLVPGLPGSAADGPATAAALAKPTTGGAQGGAAWRPVPGARPGATVSRGGISVSAPRNGLGVHGDALMADGTEHGLTVRTTADGRVLIQDEVSLPAVPAAAVDPSPAAEDVCTDNAYHLTGTWWHDTTVAWSFRAVSTPQELRVGPTARALKQGVWDITHENNDCGRSDRVSATSNYLGVTASRPNIGAPQTCIGNGDGHNVVGFGDLGPGIVAFSCWWFIAATHTNVEADMLLNKHDFGWATSTSGCNNQYIVRAIATHEFGHIYGLAHVSETQHPDMTMSTAANTCDDSPSTLGFGDMLGLERHY